VNSPAAARRRPLEPVLRRARGSARETSMCVGSSSARREARRAQTVLGSNGQRNSPRDANGGGGGLGVARGKGWSAFIGECALAKGSRGSSHSGSWHGEKAVHDVRAATANGGLWVSRRANGRRRRGRTGAARGAGQGAHKYHTQEREARRTVRWSQAHLSMRVWQRTVAGPTWSGATSRARRECAVWCQNHSV
jgi:hypothetical protein